MAAVEDGLTRVAQEIEVLEYVPPDVIAPGARSATRQRVRMGHRETQIEAAGEIADLWTVLVRRLVSLQEVADAAQDARARVE